MSRSPQPDDLTTLLIVALKMILAGGPASSADLSRFVAEAEAAAGLTHPNIVAVYETGHHAGLPYFTLEYVEGGSLAGRIHAQPLLPAEAAGLVEQLARAVHYAQTRGIVHRDLKPENVLLSSTSGGLQCQGAADANLRAHRPQGEEGVRGLLGLLVREVRTTSSRPWRIQCLLGCRASFGRWRAIAGRPSGHRRGGR